MKSGTLQDTHAAIPRRQYGLVIFEQVIVVLGSTVKDTTDVFNTPGSERDVRYSALTGASEVATETNLVTLLGVHGSCNNVTSYCKVKDG